MVLRRGRGTAELRMEQLVSVRRKACPRSSSKADGRVRAAVAVVRYEDQNVVAKYISADKMDPCPRRCTSPRHSGPRIVRRPPPRALFHRPWMKTSGTLSSELILSLIHI